MKAALTQKLYNHLALEEDIPEELMRRVGFIEKDERLAYAMDIQTPDKVSYASLRALATGDETHLYASSVRYRPLVKFAGAESSAASWRDAMRDQQVQQAQESKTL